MLKNAPIYIFHICLKYVILEISIPLHNKATN